MAQPVQRPRQPQVSPVPAGPRAPTVRVSPDGNREAARLKVVKFQQALAVMGDMAHFVSPGESFDEVAVWTSLVGGCHRFPNE